MDRDKTESRAFVFSVMIRGECIFFYVLHTDVEGGLERSVERMVAVSGGAPAMKEARATRIGPLARGGRGFEISNPWPDREFAGI
jgi:hypothetical protein